MRDCQATCPNELSSIPSVVVLCTHPLLSLSQFGDDATVDDLSEEALNRLVTQASRKIN
jgi:hypothetical protein